jgi:hypothetical protein
MKWRKKWKKELCSKISFITIILTLTFVSIKKEKLTTENGDKYEGELSNGKPHGKGTMIYTDGSRYDGEWSEGIQHGKGVSVL